MAVDCSSIVDDYVFHPGETAVFSSDQFSREIWDFFKKNRETEEKVRRKLMLRDQLAKIFKDEYGDDVELFIVGSTANGMADLTSDLDLCLVVRGGSRSLVCISDKEKLLRDIMLLLFNKLSHFQIEDPEVVGKVVPILKYNDTVCCTAVNLNINNEVGIRSTRLLYGYHKSDFRVAPLFIAIKRWAILNNIADAYGGTLSSYNWKLMLIFYLQHLKLIPSLQLTLPELMDANLDVITHCQKLPSPSCFSHGTVPNSPSLGQLFQGFIKFYLNFDFGSQVISVRLGRTISLIDVQERESRRARNFFESNDFPDWSSANINIGIEEPFTHKNSAHAVFDRHNYTSIKNSLSGCKYKLEIGLSFAMVMHINV